MKTTTTTTLLLLGCLGLAPQDPKPEPVFAIDAGTHDLRELIDRAARFLGRNYMTSDQEMQALPSLQIVLQNPIRVDREGCAEVLSQFAYQRGFAIVPIDQERGLWECIYMQGPRRGEVQNRAIFVRPDELAKYAKLRVPVTVTVPLTHVNATHAANSLRPFFMSGNNPVPPLTIGTAGNARALLMTGFADQVAQAAEMLARVDQPPPEGAVDATAPDWAQSVEQRLGQLASRVGALEAKQKER